MNRNTPTPPDAWRCPKCGRSHPLTLKGCPKDAREESRREYDQLAKAMPRGKRA